MKVFVFDPLWGELITDDLLKSLIGARLEPIVTKHIAPLSESKELFDKK